MSNGAKQASNGTFSLFVLMHKKKIEMQNGTIHAQIIISQNSYQNHTVKKKKNTVSNLHIKSSRK